MFPYGPAFLMAQLSGKSQYYRRILETCLKKNSLTALQNAGMHGHGFENSSGPPKSPMDAFDGGRTMLLGKRSASPSMSPAGSPLEDPGKRSRPPTLRLLKDEPVPDGYVRYRQVK